MAYGSEFRPITHLEPLLLHHRSWPSFSLQLMRGSMWPLTDLSESDRVQKNNEFISRGNHKSAITHHEVFKKIITQEIHQGWMIPLPLPYTNDIPNSELAPIGIDDKQWKALPDGSRVSKYRLTHDQTFEASVGTSVNNRTIREKLDPLFYGGCLSRLLHYIISIRSRLPYTKILGGKSDFKSAYRRVTLNGETAVKCMIMCEDYALLSLRLTFGGSPCSNEWCTFAELCTDLANDILHCKHWNPTILHSPHQKKLPPPFYLDDSIPFAQAAELDVAIPIDDMGRIDDFIDDGIVILPDINDNKERGVQAMLLAIHTLCRPIDNNEPILRDDCLSLDKLQEEGQLSEELIILGWRVNTRTLTIALPTKKYTVWIQDLRSVLKKKKTSIKILEKIIGRLNHSATACPVMRYFISGPRKALEKWSKLNAPKSIEKYLPKQALLDLQLWLDIFLPKIHRGISLNLITYRRPTIISWSDACPKGMGGYTHTGLAWRLEIPSKYLHRVQNKNNILEFISALITIWIALLDSPKSFYPCILALGDNTSAVGWLHKANIDETENKPLFSATRKLAELLMEKDCCLYSQHIQGIHNNVADALSRLHHLSPSDLYHHILSNYPSQVPSTFQLVQIPQEIFYWTISWLQKINDPKELAQEQKEKNIEFGTDGQSTAKSFAMNTTCSYKTYLPDSELDSLAPLLPPCEGDNFPSRMKDHWERAQWKRSWQNWVRSLGQTWGTTPPMANWTEECTPSCLDSSRE